MSAVLDFVRSPASAVSAVSADSCAPLVRAGSLVVSVASDASAIESALRLRHQVFASEFGARPAADGLDRDIFDRYCQHLIARDLNTGEVVGTYRVLLPEQARAIGCLYTEGEFWLTRLNPLRDTIVELGRACVHPDYRNGATLMLLWSGLGALLSGSGHRYLLGCVSVRLHDDGTAAANLWRRIADEHYAHENLRVWPRERLVIDAFARMPSPPVPALMKGYLRAGAQLLGEPHLDRAFGCADFPMMLRLDDLGASHRRRFMQ